MTGKHIELFLVDGVPGGITTAEIAGWTGHVLTGPRSDFAKVVERTEMQRNGAYLLLGDDESAVAGTKCYIGRTESFARRMRDHLIKKDFWDRLVLISAKDDAFNEGHWGYLEARLVDLATQASRSTLTNDNVPQGRRLSEAQASDMEAFISHLQIVLPVLGVNVLRSRVAVVMESKTVESPTFTLTNARSGVDARATSNGDEFTVLAGSVVVGSWTAEGRADSTKRSYASYRAQHEKLVADGSIEVVGSHGRLTRDIHFGSPSAAGAVILGRSCNGRTEWTWEGGTYASWEDRGLSSTATPEG